MRPRVLEDLDIQTACGLWALLASRRLLRPVSPDRDLTIEVMSRLADDQIIAVPWPETTWELPPRGFLAPVEQLSWEFTWKEMQIGGLGLALEELLEWRASDTALETQLIDTWRRLVRAECAAYYQSQLRKHGFAPSWHTDLQWLPARYWDELSLGRWKYLV